MSLRAKQEIYRRGVSSEKLAAGWLQLKGYKILERRYKTQVGEIDLITRHKNLVAFVEVKARPTKTQALESITPVMRRRIENAARHYIAQNHLHDCDLRFDVIAITPFKLKDLGCGEFFIHHLDNAWMAGA